ncbi:MAG: deoxyuridine 5'-triphosphate nucleotidohydrolase [Pelagibacterium sp. SCN 63-23]|nr:MAG: deoxyuridine 5'-triphosphate nucleotidohydrolase [Pelagibacterium sp. SCN 63-23]
MTPGAAVTIRLHILPHGEGLPLPAAHSAMAAGADLRAALPVAMPVELLPGKRMLVPCGFQMALPPGYEAQVRPRSGLAAKHGVTVLNAPGTIDADYRGEVMVILINLGETSFRIERGDRIAQMIVAPVVQPAFETGDLDATQRGTDGFGSTGQG